MAGSPSVRAVVAIGASAGGVEALTRLVAQLPDDLDAAICVVVHLSASTESVLPTILNRAGSLPAAHGSDAEPLRPGRIYVCPPDRHMLIRPDALHITRGPRENGHRPAVDPLFRSVAASFGAAAIAVVLSGTLDDGSAGLRAIDQVGGVTIVQTDATYPEMPRNAMEAAPGHHAVALTEIPDLIVRSVENAPPPSRAMMNTPTPDAPYQAPEDLEGPTDVSCPACGGVLTMSEDEPLRFRCRVGHAYGLESLIVNHGEALEAALWAALRALEERAGLLDRLATRFANRGNERQADRYREDRDLTRTRADIVRRAILDSDLVAGEPTGMGAGDPGARKNLPDVAN